MDNDKIWTDGMVWFVTVFTAVSFSLLIFQLLTSLHGFSPADRLCISFSDIYDVTTTVVDNICYVRSGEELVPFSTLINLR